MNNKLIPFTHDAGSAFRSDSRAHDVPQKKLSEQELRKSRERYQTLIELGWDMVITLSTGGDITSLNPVFEQLTDWVSADLLQKSFADIVHPDDRALAQQLWEKGLLGMTTPMISLRVKTKNGQYIATEITSALEYERETITGIFVIARDVTERKSLEAQFAHSQKMESLGSLSGGIAHDFNNVLSIILGYTEMLGRADNDPAVIKNCAQAIKTASTRGVALVNQLLTFSRKAERVVESVRVNDIVIEIANLLQETFPKTIDVTCEIQKDIPSIVADATQIHQVLLNLSVNARDAMPKGGTLTFATKTVSGASLTSANLNAVMKTYIAIEITDTGAGMDESTRLKIFEPFFTTKGPGKGTGLGLSLVHGIVANHGGLINVQSEPGNGTTFRIYFPVKECAQLSDEHAGAGLSEIPGGAETILVVEDEDMLREFMKTILATKGYNVLTAVNGEEGVEIFSRHRKEISLVITDLGLPKFGGETVIRQIKQIKPEVDIILASGFIDSNVKEDIVKTGVKHFIHKPYNSNDVLEKVRNIIDGTKDSHTIS